MQGNQLVSIEPQAFNSLTELQVLDLSFNKLFSIDGPLFKTLAKLNKLYLNNNKLVSIDSVIFQDLRNLQYLDLSSNPLIAIQNANLLSNPLCLVELKMSDVSKKLMTQIDYAIHANGNNQQCQMSIIGLPSEKKAEGKDFSRSLPLNYRVKAENRDVINTKDVETIVKS